MSDVLVEARWEGGLRFEAVGRAGIPVLVDGDGEAGITPVETLAVSLAACMAASAIPSTSALYVGTQRAADALSPRGFRPVTIGRPPVPVWDRAILLRR